MHRDNILEIGIDLEGRLFVRPRSQEFQFIYRMASGVRWDEKRCCIMISTDSRLPLVEWFKLIWRGAAQEYGVRLQIGSDAVWTGIAPGDRQAVEASILELNEEDDAILLDQKLHGPAHAQQMELQSLANDVRPKADAAFRDAKYREAAELYSQIYDVLKPSELQRLELAKRRSDKAPK